MAETYTPAENPYKGLRAFDETDAADFYGRAALVDELVHAVGDRRLVAVVGPSGIGKSSVVKAGLVRRSAAERCRDRNRGSSPTCSPARTRTRSSPPRSSGSPSSGRTTSSRSSRGTSSGSAAS